MALQQAAVQGLFDERGDDRERCAAVVGDLGCCRPRGCGKRDAASLSEAGALGGQPRGGGDHADEVALLGAQCADVRVEFVLAGVCGARAIQDVCDGEAGLLDAVLLAAERALRGERQVVRRDAQPEPATPIRKRAFDARVRQRYSARLDVGDALEVVDDCVEGVAELEVSSPGAVGVDEIAKIQAALGRGVLDRVKQLTVGLDRRPAVVRLPRPRARVAPRRAPASYASASSSQPSMPA